MNHTKKQSPNKVKRVRAGRGGWSAKIYLFEVLLAKLLEKYELVRIAASIGSLYWESSRLADPLLL